MYPLRPVILAAFALIPAWSRSTLKGGDICRRVDLWLALTGRPEVGWQVALPVGNLPGAG